MLCVWLAQERMVTFQSHQLQVGVDEYILKLLTLLSMFTAGFGYLGQVCFYPVGVIRQQCYAFWGWSNTDQDLLVSNGENILFCWFLSCKI